MILKIFKKIVFTTIILCGALVLNSCSTGKNNGIYGVGIDYIDEKCPDVVDINVDNGSMTGILSGSVKVNAEFESDITESISRVKFNFVKYDPDIIKKYSFSEYDIKSCDIGDEKIFDGYIRGGIMSNEARSIFNHRELFFIKEKLRDNEVIRVLEHYRSTLRKDLSDCFEVISDNEDSVALIDYRNKCLDLASAFGVELNVEPVCYYIYKDALLAADDNEAEEKVVADSDYILLVYENFKINGIRIYNDKVSWMHAGEWTEPQVYFLFDAKSGSLEYYKFNCIYDSDTLQSEDAFAVVDVKNAVGIAAEYFEKTNIAETVCISDVELCYVPEYAENQMLYDPAWVVTFSMPDGTNDIIQDGEADIQKIFINAINGKVML